MNPTVVGEGFRSEIGTNQENPNGSANLHRATTEEIKAL